MAVIARFIFFMFTVILFGTRVVQPLRVDPSNIEKREGDQEVHFFCYENDGTSQATGITWRDPRNNTYTPGAQSEGDRIVAEGFRLSVLNLVRGDSGSYECFRGSATARAELFVSAPPVILNPMRIQKIYHGMTSLLMCQYNPGNPAANVNWLHITYHGNDSQETLELITEGWNPRFQIVANGLQISDVRLTDEGMYRCHVRNAHGIEVLDIQAAFREPPQFVNEEVEVEIIRGPGESTSLDCLATGAPLPNVTWSVPPGSNLGRGPVQPNFTLDVQFSDGADAGEYSCTISNGVGNVTRDFTLKLAIPPEPTVKYRNLTIELNKEQKIACSTTGLPRPHFKWLIGSQPLPSSDWSTNNSDVMAISTLTYKFLTNDLENDCKIRVSCLATNAYGRSQQHFTLTPNDGKICSEILSTTSSTSDPAQQDSSTASSNHQGLGAGSGNRDDGKMSGETFKIIVGSFTVAVMVIVAGVVILLVYFLRHYCCRKKCDGKLMNKRSTGDPESSLQGGYVNSSAMMSSLHHHDQQLTSTGGEVDGGGSVIGLSRQKFDRLRSVDSGVSLSSLSPCPNCNRGNTAPPLSSRVGVGGAVDMTTDEGIYHRLDHSLSSRSSVGNASLSSSSKVRLISTSSSGCDSNSVFLHSQCSAGEVDESAISAVESSGVFIGGGGIGGGGGGGVGGQTQRRLQRFRSHSESVASSLHPGGGARGMEEAEEPGMIINPSYERHRLKITVTQSDEPPHTYERVT